MQNASNWAQAISLRIVDEHPLRDEFPEDSETLRTVLERLLSENEWAVKKLIGTGLIEECYFESLS